MSHDQHEGLQTLFNETFQHACQRLASVSNNRAAQILDIDPARLLRLKRGPGSPSGSLVTTWVIERIFKAMPDLEVWFFREGLLRAQRKGESRTGTQTPREQENQPTALPCGSA